jgi:hypothetical protein
VVERHLVFLRLPRPGTHLARRRAAVLLGTLLMASNPARAAVTPSRRQNRPYREVSQMCSTMSTTSIRVDSSQNVILPDIPELYNPDFLDVLLPPSTEPAPIIVDSTPVPANPMIDALDSTLHQTLTHNNAAAYSSTLSATLDAFLAAVNQTGDSLASHLANSWAEDAPLTLRLIWNLRSIHDGKGEKEAFYR